MPYEPGSRRGFRAASVAGDPQIEQVEESALGDPILLVEAPDRDAENGMVPVVQRPDGGMVLARNPGPRESSAILDVEEPPDVVVPRVIGRQRPETSGWAPRFRPFVPAAELPGSQSGAVVPQLTGVIRRPRAILSGTSISENVRERDHGHVENKA